MTALPLPARDANKYAAKCVGCGQTVQPGEGWLIPGKPGEKARVRHYPQCVPGYKPEEGTRP